jgi:hypothetical protein
MMRPRFPSQRNGATASISFCWKAMKSAVGSIRIPVRPAPSQTT